MPPVESPIEQDKSPSLSAGTESRQSDAPSVTVIEARRRWQLVDLAELWRYRDLIYYLTWRDIKVRYKQTELGVAWVLLQPLLTSGIFAVLFGLLIGGSNELSPAGVPYFLSTFCGMLAWRLFAESLTRAGGSLVTSRELITKVYFPRLIVPLASVLGGLVDFAITLVALVLLMVWNQIVPSWAILWLPAFVLLAVLASLAVGLWLSALAAIYRDFLYAQPFLIQVGMFVSPVIYATSFLRERLPDWALVLYGLNPMAGVIEGFRWSLLGAADPPGLVLIPSTLMTLVLLVAGLVYFRRTEDRLVDVI